jgi:hypothetical protein
VTYGALFVTSAISRDLRVESEKSIKGIQIFYEQAFDGAADMRNP